ncbi:MAG: hypothetical protein F6K21_15405 [Symploca sp. SIO2D2]|nr:hypothetical protein [Symploca sp. SIO2D2]
MNSFRGIEKKGFPDGDVATASLSFTQMEIPVSQIVTNLICRYWHKVNYDVTKENLISSAFYRQS